MLVSMYVDTSGHSVIKFGSYDHEAIRDGSHISIYPTINQKSWAIRSSMASLTSHELASENKIYNSDHHFLIDP